MADRFGIAAQFFGPFLKHCSALMPAGGAGIFRHPVGKGGAFFDDAQRNPEGVIHGAQLFPLKNLGREGVPDLAAIS